MRIALENCRLIDGRGSPSRDGMTVVIEGDRIAEVRPDDGAAGDAASRRDTFVVSLCGRTVMPGLIDCHIHFALWAFDLLNHLDQPLSYLHARTQHALEEVLRAGCTSARDLGGLDAGFRAAVDDGLCRGPRLRTSVTIISPTNGIADSTKLQGISVPVPPGMPSPGCDGADNARQRVRELVRAGADLIKLAVSGGVSSPRRSPHQRLFTADEVSAIIDEAHAWGLSVACHALGGPGPLTAIRAGADTIEHGVWLDDECVEEMAARGTWYVPTFAAYEAHELRGGPLQREFASQMKESHRASFDRARAGGVRIASGSDAGVYDFDFKRELELLVEAGMSPSDAIVAATSDAAECIGAAGEVGAVRPGLLADLLVVEGDAYADIRQLTRPGSISAVFKGGQLVHDRAGILPASGLDIGPLLSEPSLAG